MNGQRPQPLAVRDDTGQFEVDCLEVGSRAAVLLSVGPDVELWWSAQVWSTETLARALAAAHSPSTPSATFTDLAVHPHHSVRRAVASNRSAPDEARAAAALAG